MNLQVLPWLETAGKFAVEHIPCPHFVQPVNLASARTGVIHSVEGSFQSGLGVFKQHFAPHFLVGPGRIAQLVQVGVIGAALVHHNDQAIVQVEVAGKSQTSPWMFDDATAEALAALMAVCQREYGIPLTHPWPDGDYGAYGDNPHRHAGKWGVVAGWYGHGDVPSLPAPAAQESHWDPGALKWSELFARAAAMTDILHAPGWMPPAEPARPCAGCSTAPAAPGVGQPHPTASGFPRGSVADGQYRLNVAGAIPKLVVNGLADKPTRDAIASFQSRHGLFVDGLMGPKTWAMLDAATA